MVSLSLNFLGSSGVVEKRTLNFGSFCKCCEDRSEPTTPGEEEEEEEEEDKEVVVGRVTESGIDRVESLIFFLGRLKVASFLWMFTSSVSFSFL